LSRTTALLQENGTQTEAEEHSEVQEEAEKETFQWSEEEVYLAHMLYDRFMNTSLTHEMRGDNARDRLRFMQEAAEEETSEFELFSFSNPGLVSFAIRGILDNNDLQIGLKVSFGPFTSPEKRITLVNIIDHYRLVLGAMPFVSVDTRVKALEALKNFSASDVTNTAPQSSIKGEAKIGQVFYSPVTSYLVFSTRQNGQTTALWNKLKGGDMTWEVMMKFIQKPQVQTNIMGGYEFNDNRYSSANRRRSAGLFVRHDGLHFIGTVWGGTHPTGGPAGMNLFDQKWHHVVFVLAKSQQKVLYYIDGHLINSCAYSGTEDPAFDGTITIGGGHLRREFENAVSRFAIWSRAWTQDDVNKALTCGLKTSDGLEVLYTLDGGYEDVKDHYADLKMTGSGGRFTACTDCTHCPAYLSTSMKIR